MPNSLTSLCRFGAFETIFCIELPHIRFEFPRSEGVQLSCFSHTRNGKKKTHYYHKSVLLRDSTEGPSGPLNVGQLCFLPNIVIEFVIQYVEPISVSI